MTGRGGATTMAALTVVLQQYNADFPVCWDCRALTGFTCPDPWVHEAAGVCADCENIREIREEHVNDCAIRLIQKLAMSSASLRYGELGRGGAATLPPQGRPLSRETDLH